MNNQIRIFLIIMLLHRSLRIALLALRVLLLNQSLRLRPMLKLMLIHLGQKKVKKEQVSKGPHNTITSSRKKKSKTCKSHKVKDIETPPLSSISIFKKEKQSSKSLSQDDQSHLEKIIEKIIEKVLNEKFGTITTLLHPQNGNSKTPADSEDDEFIDGPMEIDFVQRKEPATDVVTVKCKIKRLVILTGTVDPGANFLIISEDISKQSKLVIDTKEKHDLRGIATTPTESLGIVRNVLVNFTSGCTIYANFAIVKYPKLMLILPNILLDKYNYDLLASK